MGEWLRAPKRLRTTLSEFGNRSDWKLLLVWSSQVPQSSTLYFKSFFSKKKTHSSDSWIILSKQNNQNIHRAKTKTKTLNIPHPSIKQQIRIPHLIPLPLPLARLKHTLHLYITHQLVVYHHPSLSPPPSPLSISISISIWIWVWIWVWVYEFEFEFEFEFIFPLFFALYLVGWRTSSV